MKFTKLFFILIIFLGLVPQSRAAETGNWQIGGAGGFAVGNFANFFFDDEDDDFSVYNGADVIASVAYTLSPRTRLRLNVGLEKLFNEDEATGIFDNHLSLIAEFAALLHFRKNPTLFDPYAVVGVGYPTLPHVGLGNSFKITDRVSFYVEALGSSLIVHNRADMRFGVMWRF